MQRQRGVAIVLAMSVVAMAALAATAIIVAQSTWARRSTLSNDHAQAQLLIQTGLDWGRAVLSDDLLVSNVDHAREPWAMVLPAVPVENGSLLGHIEDQQGKFNLNNLLLEGTINPGQVAVFERLLKILGLSSALAGSVTDWIDADNQRQSAGGAEDEHYQSLAAPYLTANRPMLDVAELALLAGFDASVRERLRPHVTALPGYTHINTNTATAEVLAAVVEGLGLDGARVMVGKRERAWFRSFLDFNEQLPATLRDTPGPMLSAQVLGVTSDFFMASATVSSGSARAQGSALLARGSGGWPVVLWRKYP